MTNKTSPIPTSAGIKAPLLQAANAPAKPLGTLTTAKTPVTQVVYAPALLRIEPNDPELVGPTHVVKQMITGKLEHGKRTATNAIVLHMTGGEAAKIFGGYTKPRAKGAHFLITKSGEIVQTAKLGHGTWHVGAVRPKGYRPTGDNSNAEDQRLLAKDETQVLRDPNLSFTRKIEKLHDLQEKKPYGSDPNDNSTRFPTNEDSIGIEFEALNDEKSKPKSQANVNYDKLTPKQIESGKRLIKFLMKLYGLTDADIFEHPDISYKTFDEARGTKTQVTE